MIQLPIPENFDSFTDWASNICLQSGSAPLPTTEDWKRWGVTAGLLDIFPIFINPNIYTEWKSWASKLIDGNK